MKKLLLAAVAALSLAACDQAPPPWTKAPPGGWWVKFNGKCNLAESVAAALGNPRMGNPHIASPSAYAAWVQADGLTYSVTNRGDEVIVTIKDGDVPFYRSEAACQQRLPK
jgi:hypothetical protein